jgi:tetratricopeptide (TPR) repeat protein
LSLAWSAAAALFLLTLAAGWQWKSARSETARAEQNYAKAKNAVNHLINDVAIGLRNVQGIRVETIARVLDTVKKTVGDLAVVNPNDVELQTITASMLYQFATTYKQAGDLNRARAATDESLAAYRTLAAKYPDNQSYQMKVSEGIHQVADLMSETGDRAGAIAAFDESLETLAIDRKLAAADPSRAIWQTALANDLGQATVMRHRAGDRTGALAAYDESLAIARKLVAAHPDNPDWQIG